MICTVKYLSVDWDEQEVLHTYGEKPLTLNFKGKIVEVQRKGFQKYTLKKASRNSKKEEFFYSDTRPDLLVFPIGEQIKKYRPRLFTFWKKTHREELDCSPLD